MSGIILVHNSNGKFCLDLKEAIKAQQPSATILMCTSVRDARRKYKVQGHRITKVITSDRGLAEELKNLVEVHHYSGRSVGDITSSVPGFLPSPAAL